MDFNFKAIALSYKTAPLDIREEIALDEGAIRRLLSKIQEITSISETLIISTCNRTEIYYSSEEDKSTEFIKLVGIEKMITNIDSYFSYFQVINNPQEAIRRLFRVSVGLESQVVGDLQIINQVKNAYQWTADANLAGAFLHRLLHTIFFTNKKIVQETEFRTGAASVSYATVEMIEELARQLVEPKILVIGLGEIGSDVVRNLKNTPLPNVKLANRTYQKAVSLAEELSYQAIDFEQIFQNIQEADFIVCAIQKNEPFITKAIVSQLNILSFKYFFDLSVPRSIEPEIEQTTGALLYNIDTINNRVDETLQRRKEAIPQVEELVNLAVADFENWAKEMIVSPVIQKLKNLLEQIRKEELERYMKQLDEIEIEKIDRITKSMMQKIIKMPVLQLKAACKRGEAETLAEVLSDLFDLEKQELLKNVRE
jgi:glutamyl-tRNA reductase